MNSGGAENKTALAIRDVNAAVGISVALTVIAALLVGGRGDGNHGREAKPERHDERGFTLIEISIVLVIIGLIVGGVLVGQSLIAAAGVRATVTQIEKYNQATNTFRGKYGYLPGDIPNPDATNFGFVSRGQYAGEGDGNGVIEGAFVNTANENRGFALSTGETAMFWVDLATAGLIKETFNAATPSTLPSSTITAGSVPSLSAFFPGSQLGPAFICVYSWNGVNYYSLLGITSMSTNGLLTPSTMLSVQQAYSIDAKVDDGLPQSGNVTAAFLNLTQVLWA